MIVVILRLNDLALKGSIDRLSVPNGSPCRGCRPTSSLGHSQSESHWQFLLQRRSNASEVSLEQQLRTFYDGTRRMHTPLILVICALLRLAMLAVVDSAPDAQEVMPSMLDAPTNDWRVVVSPHWDVNHPLLWHGSD